MLQRWKVFVCAGLLCLAIPACATLEKQVPQTVPVDQHLFQKYGFICRREKGAFVVTMHPKAENEQTRLHEVVRAYLDRHLEIDQEIHDHLLNLSIALGMTKEHVELLWGPPHRIQAIEGPEPADQGREVWCYFPLRLSDAIPIRLSDAIDMLSRRRYSYELTFQEDVLVELVHWYVLSPFAADLFRKSPEKSEESLFPQ